MHNSYGNSSRTLIENDDVDLPIPIQENRSINNEITSIMNSSTSASSSDNQILSGIECLGTAAFFHEALQNGFQTFNVSQCPPNALPILYETLFNYLNSCSSPPQTISTNNDTVLNVNNETTTYVPQKTPDLFVPTSNLSQNCFVSSNPVNSYVSQTELNKNYNFYQPTPTRFFTPYASKNVMSNMVDAVLAHEQEQQQNLRLPNLLPTNILQTSNAIQKLPDREKFQSKSSMKPIYLGSYSMPVCSSSNDVSPPTPSTVSIPDVNVLSFYDEDTCEEYTTDDDEENAGTSDETDDFISVDYSKNVTAFSGVGVPTDIEGIKRRYRLDRKIGNLARRDRRRIEKLHYTSVFKRKEKNKSFKKTTVKNFSSDDECNASSTFVEIKIQDKCFPVNRRFHFKSRSSSNTILDLVGLHFANLHFPSLPMLRHDGPNVKIFKKLKRKFRVKGKLQNHLCHDLPGVSLCLECFESRHTANDTDYCRFMDFRQLCKVDNGLGVAGFITYNNKKSSSCNNPHQEFLPPASSMKTWSLETAVYVLSNINRQFKSLLNREKKFLSDCLRWNFVGNFNEPLPWRDAFNVRELCDVCSTTIFNLHLICNNCALAVCSDCVYARIRREPRCEIPSPHQDNFGWAFCSTKQKRQHCPTDLRLAQLIPDENSAILSTLESLNNRVVEQIERYKLTNQFEFHFSRNKFTYEPPMHRYMFQGAILVLKESKNAENLFLFQKHWKNATPVLVENVTQGLNLSIWQPSVMKMKCEGRASSGSIVDCRTGSVIDNLDASSFWDGFIDCHRRVTGYDNRKLYLKLKDWPPAETFSNVLREHYADLCDSLPIPEYTHPRRGAFNLATNLPSFCVEPDLGPKMYTAYEMIFEPSRGTTNLHLDISCAVNILVSVTTPLNINTNYLYKSVLEHLEGQGLDPEDFERAKRNPDKVGALWTIFRPEDSEAIRSFLFELAEEQRKTDFDDPIHDQMCYLHVQLRQRLEQERGVKGFTFVQMLGDAVFIPAGAAHQVQNMLCCIKVAEDFVSPEGVSRCAAVAGEFRNLTKQHSNHEDKLQLPNIVLHSVREAVRTLELNEPALFCK